MSGAAQRIDGTAALEFDGADDAVQVAASPDNGLKQAVAERLAAHREKRAAARQQLADLTAQKMRDAGVGRGSSRVREAVAARYHQSQSYREFLAAEAERALQQAQAEAEVAARNARAMAEAKVQLFEEMEQWDRFAVPTQAPELTQAFRGELAHALADIALGAEELIRERNFELERSHDVEQHQAAGLTVQLCDGFEPAAPSLLRRSVPIDAPHAEEIAALDEEIEFRRAPELGEFVIEAQPIPANIIEFPRQLVAPKKARPRLAEGPLREEAPQLRIFEVDAEQISAEPQPGISTAAPDWQSMKLEATVAAVTAAPQHAQTQFTLQPQTASISRRVMAAVVDGICIGAAFLGFVAVAVWIVGPRVQIMPKPLIGVATGVVLFTLYIAYELLFFSLNGDTPGMRYARIGLCTFGDRNPSRKAMRRRIFATLLAVFPVGLGLLWACLDDERLGWHDRMSRMYQRAY